MTGRRPRVLAVVVTYHPARAEVMPLLRALAPQVDALVLVDNTPSDGTAVADPWPEVSAFAASTGSMQVVRLGANRGIAAAQNVGIDAALAGGFDYVLLSDQDSLPAMDMVAALVGVAEGLRSEGRRVGCVCPVYFDRTTGHAFPFQVQRPGRFFYGSIDGELARPSIEILTTISSGSLLPCAALADVGGMREDFFIDHVDTEWCHRARSRGYSVHGTALARLNHRLGDDMFDTWYFGWRPYSAYSPTRLYYRFRNFVLLCHLPHVPKRWSLRAAWYWLGNLYSHVLFAPGRAANARMILRGLADGLRGRSGPLR